MQDYDFSMILQGMLDFNRYRDYRVTYTTFDGQNTIVMGVVKPGGEPFEAEIKFKVL